MFKNIACFIVLFTFILFLQTQAQDSTVFFPYLNGKSTDDLFPYLTTSESSHKILIFPSGHPLKALSYVEDSIPRERLRLLEGNALDEYGLSLNIVPGLSGHIRSVSFQWRKHPGMYVHRCEDVYLCMSLNESTENFINRASFIELYAMDGSGGRSYQSVNNDIRYFGSSIHGNATEIIDGKLVRMVKNRYTGGFARSVSWDIRVIDGNGATWTRSRKKAEMQHFSGGTVLFARESTIFALGIAYNSRFRAALTDKEKRR